MAGRLGAGRIEGPEAQLALERAALRAEACLDETHTARPSQDQFEALEPPAVRSVLDRVLMGSRPADGLEALHEGGALAALLPEVEALVGFSDAEWRHKDVWKHTKQVVEQSVCLLGVRWGALLHDIGKVKTRRIEPNGEVHFIGHAEVGARMFDKLARRSRWFASDPALRDQVRFLIRHHLRASQYDGTWTDGAVRRFAREMGAYLEDLLNLSRADITTKRPEKRRRGIALIDELAARITELAAEDALVPPLPSGFGNHLMQHFDLPPSKRIGEIKQALESAVQAGELEPHQDAEYYLRFVSEHRAKFGL